jgi:lactobin A/cerein 7B family class IIb bacteriocin
MTMIDYSNASLLPEPIELSESELESVAGGGTPVTVFVPSTPWLWTGAVAAAAGAAAAILNTINEIQKDNREEEEKKRTKPEGY